MPLTPKKSVIAAIAKRVKKIVTDVYDITTGDIVATYSLPPDKAVVCAYYQLGLKNMNTWQYEYNAEVSKFGFIKGCFWALKKGK
jgi:hypothetical protein